MKTTDFKFSKSYPNFNYINKSFNEIKNETKLLYISDRDDLHLPPGFKYTAWRWMT